MIYKKGTNMEKKILLFICLFICVSDFFYGKEKVPYKIYGEIKNSIETENEKIVLEIYFENRSEKTISKFSLVTFIYDQEGNSPIKKNNNIVIEETVELNSKDIFTDIIDLESYIDKNDDDSYTLEFLYVSIIEYSDGSIWLDPFGTKVF